MDYIALKEQLEQTHANNIEYAKKLAMNKSTKSTTTKTYPDATQIKSYVVDPSNGKADYLLLYSKDQEYLTIEVAAELINNQKKVTVSPFADTEHCTKFVQAAKNSGCVLVVSDDSRFLKSGFCCDQVFACQEQKVNVWRLKNRLFNEGFLKIQMTKLEEFKDVEVASTTHNTVPVACLGPKGNYRPPKVTQEGNANAAGCFSCIIGCFSGCFSCILGCFCPATPNVTEGEKTCLFKKTEKAGILSLLKREHLDNFAGFCRLVQAGPLQNGAAVGKAAKYYIYFHLKKLLKK